MILRETIRRLDVADLGQDYFDRRVGDMKRRLLREVSSRMHMEFVHIETVIDYDFSALNYMVECRALFFPKGTRDVIFDEAWREFDYSTNQSRPIPMAAPANNVTRGIEL